jgi:hypothetical protein
VGPWLPPGCPARTRERGGTGKPPRARGVGRGRPWPRAPPPRWRPGHHKHAPAHPGSRRSAAHAENNCTHNLCCSCRGPSLPVRGLPLLAVHPQQYTPASSAALPHLHQEPRALQLQDNAVALRGAVRYVVQRHLRNARRCTTRASTPGSQHNATTHTDTGERGRPTQHKRGVGSQGKKWEGTMQPHSVFGRFQGQQRARSLPSKTPWPPQHFRQSGGARGCRWGWGPCMGNGTHKGLCRAHTPRRRRHTGPASEEVQTHAPSSPSAVR